MSLRGGGPQWPPARLGRSPPRPHLALQTSPACLCSTRSKMRRERERERKKPLKRPKSNSHQESFQPLCNLQLPRVKRVHVPPPSQPQSHLRQRRADVPSLPLSPAPAAVGNLEKPPAGVICRIRKVSSKLCHSGGARQPSPCAPFHAGTQKLHRKAKIKNAFIFWIDSSKEWRL